MTNPAQIKTAELHLAALEAQNKKLDQLISLSRQTVHELAVLNFRNAKLDFAKDHPGSHGFTADGTPHELLDQQPKLAL